MAVRHDSIRVRLNKLHDMLVKLESMRARGEETYLRDDILQAAIERTLQVAVQCVLDIGNHLIAELSLPLPEENDEIIQTLVSGGVISPALAQRLTGIGGFRNILVHDYLFLDPERIFREHLNRLDDLRDFAAEIVKFLDQMDAGQRS